MQLMVIWTVKRFRHDPLCVILVGLRFDVSLPADARNARCWAGRLNQH